MKINSLRWSLIKQALRQKELQVSDSVKVNVHNLLNNRPAGNKRWAFALELWFLRQYPAVREHFLTDGNIDTKFLGHCLWVWLLLGAFWYILIR